MPDLNLIDEGGFDESPAPVAPPPKKKRSGGGGLGGGIKILLIVVIIAVLGGSIYILNKRGIIKLWGKKKPLITQMQEDEPFMQEPIEQAQPVQQPADTAIALVEAPPIEEKAAASKTSEPSIDELMKDDDETEPEATLGNMAGEFTIQVVAYREKSKAVETMKNLEIAGYPAFIEKVPMKGGEWYTVRIGRYPSRKAAQNAVKTFAAQLQANYVIDKIRRK